ncbi:MAG: hypothetical protein Kow0068_23790 [Marinilabiliales bacterium]
MKLSLYFLIIILCFASCKKYEEGPCISLRSKDNRINATWDVDKIIINGIDSINYLNIIVSVFDIRSKDNKCIIYFYDKINNNYLPMKGNWQWYNEKKQIIMQFYNQDDLNYHDNIYYDVSVGPIKSYNTVTFSIIKLKKNDCILETNFNNKTYKFIMANY